ncbi:MAG TPA: PIG-L deacetylase family protein, partial [Allosphingosinicella sp.]|nr:PIG-L deacetylase family protein [Allosphingosinicella sp.]
MSILVIAPHADDETLGMGGTIARLAAEGREVIVGVVTAHGEEPHPIWPASFWETIHAEARQAAALLGVKEVIFGNLPAVCVPDRPVHEVNQAVGKLISDVDPEELYLPFYHDLHQDHSSIAYAALVHARAYRDPGRGIRLVAMYETPTETHLFPPQLKPHFAPSMWVDISATLETKLAAWDCYKSQHHEGATPRSAEAVRALAVSRGAEIGVAAAEAF